MGTLRKKKSNSEVPPGLAEAIMQNATPKEQTGLFSLSGMPRPRPPASKQDATRPARHWFAPGTLSAVTEPLLGCPHSSAEPSSDSSFGSDDNATTGCGGRSEDVGMPDVTAKLHLVGPTLATLSLHIKTAAQGVVGPTGSECHVSGVEGSSCPMAEGWGLRGTSQNAVPPGGQRQLSGADRHLSQNRSALQPEAFRIDSQHWRASMDVGGQLAHSDDRLARTGSTSHYFAAPPRVPQPPHSSAQLASSEGRLGPIFRNPDVARFCSGNQGSASPGSLYQRSASQRSASPGPANQGSASPGSANQGSSSPGSANHGSASPVSANQGSASPAEGLGLGIQGCERSRSEVSVPAVKDMAILKPTLQKCTSAGALDSKATVAPSSAGDQFVESPSMVLPSVLQQLNGADSSARLAAVRSVRLLCKDSTAARHVAVDLGFIPPLLDLVREGQGELLEHSVTALLNIALTPGTHRPMFSGGIIPSAVSVLNGMHSQDPALGHAQAPVQEGLLGREVSQASKENAAALLFVLTATSNQARLILGATPGSVPGLLTLLLAPPAGAASLRGRKDATLALFNLSLADKNRPLLVSHGAVPSLLSMLSEYGSGLEEKAAAVLANLAKSPEGLAALLEGDGVPKLVETAECGTPRAVEDACSALVLLAARREARAQILAEGFIPTLGAIAETGTSRAKAKATALLAVLK